MPTEFLFVEEVAEEMRVPVSCVRYWIRTGKLESLRPGRRVLVRRSALDLFIEHGERRSRRDGERAAGRTGSAIR